MIQKVLIANRGEIALRISTRFGKWEFRLVAVFTEPDKRCASRPRVG